MNKVSFDFDSEEVLIEDGIHEVRQYLPGLAERKSRILAAAGVIQLQVSLTEKDMESILDDGVDVEELSQKVLEALGDIFKAQHPESLN